jgi:hypothetical protein
MFVALAQLMLCACDPPPPRRPVVPERSGASLLLNLSPANRPEVRGSYDFELLEAVGGKTCISRSNRTSVYWVGLQDLSQMHPDPLTQQAIAAAAYDAISRLEDADSIVLTRVVAEGQGSDRVCANVYGRGVRLIKAGEPAKPPTPKRNETELEGE